MVSSGLLRRVALVRTDVSEEPGASFIRVTRATRRNNPEDTILRSLLGTIRFIRPKIYGCLHHYELDLVTIIVSNVWRSSYAY
jgi:hypothetical protein